MALLHRHIRLMLPMSNLSFSPSSLPAATVGVAYSQTLTVTNGNTCTFSTSGTVPPGLSLSFSGLTNTATLSGTPSSSGTFGFTVSASCANGSVSQAYSVNVANANLSFSPSSLPAASAGVGYSQVLTVTNGDTCKFSTSGTVPPGLSLGSTGNDEYSDAQRHAVFFGDFWFYCQRELREWLCFTGLFD